MSITTNNSPHLLQALLLDDEEDACANLKSVLERYWSHSIDISGIATSTTAAEQMIKQMPPDVVFIDIEMPGENAFQFLERISPFTFEIIFVTAYDEYALRALKLNAVDYILKPISLEELEQAIKKLEEKIALKQLASQILPQNNFAPLSEQILQKANPDRIVLKSKTELQVVHFKDIHFIEANGSYAHFHFDINGKPEVMIMSRPLVDYEEVLPPELFYRIHKSYLINCNHVKNVNKTEQYTVSMSNKVELPLSRRRYIGLIEHLKLLK